MLIIEDIGCCSMYKHFSEFLMFYPAKGILRHYHEGRKISHSTYSPSLSVSFPWGTIM